MSVSKESQYCQIQSLAFKIEIYLNFYPSVFWRQMRPLNAEGFVVVLPAYFAYNQMICRFNLFLVPKVKVASIFHIPFSF